MGTLNLNSIKKRRGLMKIEIKNRRFALMSSVACLSVLCGGQAAHAFTYQFNNGVNVRLDNTIEYSVIERASPTNAFYTNNPNTNDGDQNLRSGIVSNKFDLISTLDISYQGFGFDASTESFYDTVYNQNTQNTNGATYNPASTSYKKFTSETIASTGRNVELRNLFGYGAGNIAGIPVSLKIGRLVNIFGESLFMAGNGISYGQSPINAELAASVPNTQAKNLFLPVGQALLTVDLTNSIALTAYYQFEWEKFNDNPAGSFFSPADLLDEGGQRLYLASLAPYINNANPGAAAYLYRANDLKGSDTGQFGAALHYDPIGSNWDYGFYALQYNDTSPQVYARIGAGAPKLVSGTAAGSPLALSAGTYQLVYANGIQIYGVSASTTVGPFNFAGEASIRANEDLVSSVTLLPGQTAGNNEGDAAYAIGDVAHYQANMLYAGPKIPGVWDSSSVAAEVGGENLFAITKNKQNFDTAASQHAAFGIRAVGSATYFEVLSGLDLTPSIGLGWNFMGKSPDTIAFNDTGIDRGGDLTLGISYTYMNLWHGGITYSRSIAPPGRDVMADRDFVSVNVQRTF
jgi:hypothetical protein